MDPVTLIVGALAAGAASGGDVTSSALKDGYAGLKKLIKVRFAGRPAAEVALEEHEKAPEAWEAALRQQIAETRADHDDAVVAAAEALVKEAKQAGIKTKFDVDVTGDVGIIGDHGHIDRFK